MVTDPIKGETFDEYLKRSQKRTGSKNKRRPTFNIRQAYNLSALAKKKEIPFEVYTNTIRKRCQELKEFLMSGDCASVPEFGVLQTYLYESSMAKRTKKDGSPYVIDYRSIDFRKALQNKYLVKNGEEGTDSYKRSGMVVLDVRLTRKKHNEKAHQLRFEPTKNLVRDIKNSMYGGEYKTFNAKVYTDKVSENMAKKIWKDFLTIAEQEFQNVEEFCFILPLLGKIYRQIKKKRRKNENQEVQTTVHVCDNHDE